jgi:hypothetical protein
MKKKRYLPLLMILLGSCSGLFAGELTWNGYFNWSFSDDSRPSSNSSFDAFALSLIPQMEINDRASLYSQLVYEHAMFIEVAVDTTTGARSLDKRSSGEFTVNDAYLKLDVADNLDVRFGKFATPFGLWNTAQYADPTFLTARLPGRDTFYSRGTEPRLDTHLFSRYAMGVWARGRWKIFDGDLYISNGRTKLSQHADDNNNKGIGARVTAGFKARGFQKFNLAYSGYSDTTSTDTVSTDFQENRTHAVSVDAQMGPWILLGEYGNATRGPAHLEAAYALVGYSVRDRWIPFLRHEMFEPNRRTGTDRTRVTGGGVRFNMNPEDFYGVNFKVQVDRIASEDTAKDKSYNRLYMTVGAGF